MGRRIGWILLTLISIWGALAQIAPTLFQVSEATVASWSFGWLLSPKIFWLLFPVIVGGFAFYLSRLWDRVDTLGQDCNLEIARVRADFHHRLTTDLDGMTRSIGYLSTRLGQFEHDEQHK